LRALEHRPGIKCQVNRNLNMRDRLEDRNFNVRNSAEDRRSLNVREYVKGQKNLNVRDPVEDRNLNLKNEQMTGV
jgi:hypothetical protein